MRYHLCHTPRHHDLDGWLNILVYFTVFFVVSLPGVVGYVPACVGAGYIYGVWYVYSYFFFVSMSSMLVEWTTLFS